MTQVEERQPFSQPWSMVQRMFTDPAYFETKSKQLGRNAVKILDHERSGDAFRIRLAFDEKPSIELPGFAQKFVGKSAHVIQEDRWDLKARSGRISIELVGLPLRIGAAMKIEDTAEGCVNVLQWSVACSVPLIGGKLEKLIAADILHKARADHTASRELLKNYG